ncbi:hypothetical protein [uncultured Weissella sp.]|nr:hypothetical protein [uncultured Weissella sp.]
MTFDDALKELMTKSYYSLNNFAISMKDAEEIILDLRNAYENWRLEK